NNLKNIEKAIEALKKEDAQLALDEYLWAIDNNWYAYDFDKDVFDYYTDYALDQPEDRLAWGAGRIVGHEDLFDVIHSLKNKKAAGNNNFDSEIEILEKAVKNQTQIL